MISGKTDLVFLLTDPVRQVKAPTIFNEHFVQRGIDARLVPLHVAPDRLATALSLLASAENVRGLLVTMPHKRAVVGLCDALGPRAALARSANAIRFDNGSIAGEMFDGLGLVNAAGENGIELRGKRVLLIGSGGAGRAIAFALADAGVTRLTIANRTRHSAAALVSEVRDAVPGFAVEVGDPIAGDHDVVINATPVGMGPDDESPVDIGALTEMISVIDIITSPESSALVQAAHAHGAKAIGGAPMLLGQLDTLISYWLG